MNEVFEKLSDVFEELRSDAGEREYSIQTEEAKKADKELKKENREYEKFLSDLSTEQRNFLENYMDIVDCHASNYSSHLRQLYRRLNPTSPSCRLSQRAVFCGTFLSVLFDLSMSFPYSFPVTKKKREKEPTLHSPFFLSHQPCEPHAVPDAGSMS